jgi:hypothetical protein
LKASKNQLASMFFAFLSFSRKQNRKAELLIDFLIAERNVLILLDALLEYYIKLIVIIYFIQHNYFFEFIFSASILIIWVSIRKLGFLTDSGAM